MAQEIQILESYRYRRKRRKVVHAKSAQFNTMQDQIPKFCKPEFPLRDIKQLGPHVQGNFMQIKRRALRYDSHAYKVTK